MFRLSNCGSSLLSGEKRAVLIELNCGFERNYRVIFFDVSWVDAWPNDYFIVFVGRVRSQHSYQLTASRLAVSIKNHSRRQMELCHGVLVWRQSGLSFPVTPFMQTLNTRVKQSRISVVTLYCSTFRKGWKKTTFNMIAINSKKNRRHKTDFAWPIAQCFEFDIYVR